MDLLSQHEAFLRAIFDAPDDDTPRLVYADFLQENGEEERAELIRWQCGIGPRPVVIPDFIEVVAFDRGFPTPWKMVTLASDELSDPAELRRKLIGPWASCFAVEGVKVCGRRVTSAEPLDVLFGLAAFARVTNLVLAGKEELDAASLGSDYTPFVIEPVVTTAGVAALAHHRGMRRITSLDLRDNELDNDAARALVKSPYLDNLKRLQLLEGNRLRGRVWQQVIERFGEDVVG